MGNKGLVSTTQMPTKLLHDEYFFLEIQLHSNDMPHFHFWKLSYIDYQTGSGPWIFIPELFLPVRQDGAAA